jgi:hypothetical protein
MTARAKSIVVVMLWLAGCDSGTPSPDAGPGVGGNSGSAGSSGAAGSTGAGGNTGSAGTGAGGSNTVGRGGTTGQGGAAGRGGATGGGGTSGNPCANATTGNTCSEEGRQCGTCIDRCNFCSKVTCRSGRWERMEIAPAPCFDCGASLRCAINMQYCIATLPGVPTGVTSYACAEVPDSCPAVPTCDCIQIGGGTCSMSASGSLTVTLAAP